MLKAEAMAEVAYEANRAYNDTIGNPWIDPPWAGLEPWYRAAIIDGVEGVLAGQLPPQLHSRWCAYYIQLGWTYGPVKDLEAKTHPNLVSWDKLPPEQQLKDVLFREHILMLARVGVGFGLPS